MKVNRLLVVAGIAFLSLVLVSVVLEAADVTGLSLSPADAPLLDIDFGDAPEPTYPTTEGEDGARHLMDGTTYLGNSVDAELDGQPDPAARGDDNDGNDDEDGVLFLSPLVVGQVAGVDLIASAQGWLNAWLDFNIDGDWADAGEQIFTDEALVAGTNPLTFTVPADATTGLSFSRFRFSTQEGLNYTTPVEDPPPDGEVEDHQVLILDSGPPPPWDKWVNGQPWTQEGLIVTVETSQTVAVVDLVRVPPGVSFDLYESWNSAHLKLRDYAVEPPGFSAVFTDAETLHWQVPPDHPEVMTLIKWFHVEPSTWLSTTLIEELQGWDLPEPLRPVVFEKEPPILWIDALVKRDVTAGQLATFTLSYGNDGGKETGVTIWNNFPPEARFIESTPSPADTNPEGTFAVWDIGELDSGVREPITVTVEISSALEISDTLVITDYIRDHLGRDADWVLIEYHITDTLRGWLDGYVLDAETGGQDPTCTPATVGIEPDSIEANASTATGYYGPVSLISGTHTVEAFASGYMTGTEMVDVLTGMTTTQNVYLQRPVIDVMPASLISVTAYISQPTTYQIAIVNSGHQPLDFEILEGAAGTDLPWVSEDPISGTVPSLGETPIDVIFHCTEPRDYVGSLQIVHNDPCQPQIAVPIQLHCLEPTAPQWVKWIDQRLWTPESVTVTVETYDTVIVEDVVSAPPGDPFNLIEHWDPQYLSLQDYELDPLAASLVFTDEASLFWEALLDHPEVITLTKIFYVKPSTWPSTTLSEELQGLDLPNLFRPVTFEKEPPALWIDAQFEPPVLTGAPANFSLLYGNDGGYENDVMIRNDFPPEAPFAGSDPPPDRGEPGDLRVEWDLGDLARNDSGSISVTVDVAPGLWPSATVLITDVILDHVGDEQDRVVIEYHVEPPPGEWEKRIDGMLWDPGIIHTIETSQTIEVMEVVRTDPAAPFVLVEDWNPEHLKLTGYAVEPFFATEVISESGHFSWDVPFDHPPEIILRKEFHVEPSTWPGTTLREELLGLDVEEPVRPVVLEKWQPALFLDSTYSGEVHAGHVVTFTLEYGNNGGFENDVWIRNEFPPAALFLDANPPADWHAPDGSEAIWNIGDLETDKGGEIDVTVAISSTLQPSTPIAISDVLYNHVDQIVAETVIDYHVIDTPPQSDDADIYLKDNALDDGSVPSSPPWWTSPDIWVRTDGDCAQTEHQNPIAGALNTICVRVRNRGSATVHNISVDAYWGSAALGFVWPAGWSVAGSAHIASLAPGDEAVRAVAWHTPDITGHFCLLVRIDSLADPVASGFDTVLPVDLPQNNNNISMLNVNIVDFPEITECDYVTTTVDTDVVYFDVVNTTNHVATVDVEFDSAGFPLGTGQIVVDPGVLWGRWSSLTNMSTSGSTLLPTAFPASIDGISMAPYETARMTMTITAEIDEQFILQVTEKVGGGLVGGIEYRRDLPYCEWNKWIDGTPWSPELKFTVETSQTFTVTDVVTVPEDFALREVWDSAHLTLLSYRASNGAVTQGPGWLDWSGVASPTAGVTLTKLFLAKPCTWTVTILEEYLNSVNVPGWTRPVTIEKEPPLLWIDADHDPGVYSGEPAAFTLSYGNDGAFENDVVIRNEFPEEAPFVGSDPPADKIGPGRLWVEWEVGNLPGGASGSIDVEVEIKPGLQPSATLVITDDIVNHAGEELDRVVIEYHVEPVPWVKWIEDEQWRSGITFSVKPSDTIDIVDVVALDPTLPFTITETWDPGHLSLVGHTVDPEGFSQETGGDGRFTWQVRAGHPEVITLTKQFLVEPGTWSVTTLEEAFEGLDIPEPIRAVTFEKGYSVFLPLTLKNFSPTSLALAGQSRQWLQPPRDSRAGPVPR